MEKLLIIDDDESLSEALRLVLSKAGYEVFIADSAEAALDLIEKNKVDLILSDLKLPGMSGIDLLTRVKLLDEDLPFVIMTAYDESTSTIKAMQHGAYDYIEKPLDVERLKTIIKRALEGKKISSHLSVSISKDSGDYCIENSLIGKTPVMKEILKKIGKVSNNRVNILIQGESGTGKELITRIIHFTGITKTEPFIAVNCTALTESLLESELFGHVKGSFTGAIKDTKGKFELAGQGTIFLDEVAEISPNLQVKLLRVLQEKEFEKVGGEVTIPMQARIVAATNRNLQEYVDAGKFREDLYYRLKVFTIDVPPLRERREDIPGLILHLLKKINKELHKSVRKVPIEVIEMLQNYEWIGNVRELENTLLQAVVLTDGDILNPENILLRKKVALKDGSDNMNYGEGDKCLDEIDKEYIRLVLNKVNWNKTRACAILKISKPTLDKKIRDFHLEPRS
ncbi:MAG TPA: sigma-54 dependent transcriptional regulator [Ignavibacteriaceae bacterium]|nr:sigma-54 dependent transcriptional regulator [Ignavibacteriaceae bacterium]